MFRIIRASPGLIKKAQLMPAGLRAWARPQVPACARMCPGGRASPHGAEQTKDASCSRALALEASGGHSGGEKATLCGSSRQHPAPGPRLRPREWARPPPSLPSGPDRPPDVGLGEKESMEQPGVKASPREGVGGRGRRGNGRRLPCVNNKESKFSKNKISETVHKALPGTCLLCPRRRLPAVTANDINY